MIFQRGQEEEQPKKNIKKDPRDDVEWDKKRILITGFFLVVLLLAGIEVKKMFIDKNQEVLGQAVRNQQITLEKPNVKPPVNLSSEVDSKISEIKNTVANLDAGQVATSSPQIQKVLRDIQGIKDLPANQAKDACMRICSGI